MNSRSPASLVIRWAATVPGIVFLLAACRGNPVSRLTATSLPSSPSPIPIGHIGNPVTANGQWKPVIQQFDGVEMVLVPAGCFMMGSTDEQLKVAAEITGQELDWIKGLGENEQPVNKVCFDQPFWIDRLEVTNAQFAHFGEQAERESEWNGDYRPRIDITKLEASILCQKRGARLPTEAEWEYAARGPDSSLFPWGNTFVADNVIYMETSGWRTWDVGSKPAGASWVGALDMAGNAAEWVSSLDMPYPYNAADGREAETDSDHSARWIARGGSFFTDNNAQRSASREFTQGDENDRGFRCARSTTNPQADMQAADAAPTAVVTTTPTPPANGDVIYNPADLPTAYNGPLPEGAVAQLGLGDLLVSSVSPDGKYVALGSQTCVLIYRVDTLEVVWSFPSSYTSYFAWTHDGARLAADSLSGITVYDISSGHTLLKLSGDHASWTPDDRFLVSATRSGVDIWDGTTGQKLRTLMYDEIQPPSEAQGIEDMIFALSPDSKMLATAFTYSSEAAFDRPGRTVVVWDITTGARLSVIDKTEIDPDDIMAGVFDFAWSPNSRILALGVNTSTTFFGIEFWDPLAGEKQGAIEYPGYHYALSWSPDGKKLVAYGGVDSEVVDTTTYQSLFRFDLDSGGELLGWSTDSSQFAVQNWYTDSITILDSSTGAVQLLPSPMTGSSAFTPDFKRFFFFSGKPDYAPGRGNTYEKPYRSLIEWDTKTGSVQKVLATGTSSGSEGVVWSPDSTRVAMVMGASRGHNQILIWDVKANKPVVSLDNGQGRAEMHAQWSPDGKLFINARAGLTELYDASAWTRINTIPLYLRRMDWSPDSRRIAVQDEDAQLTVIDVLEGQIAFQKQTLDRYSIVSWLSDGKQIATVGEGGHIELWNADTGERLAAVSGPSVEMPELLSFSPDLSMLASASDCQQFGCESANVWSTASGQLLHTFTGTSIYFNEYTDTLWSPWLPDGSGLALQIGKSVGLYDPRTGELLKPLPGLPYTFSPDGHLFATVYWDRGVILWPVPD